MLLAVLPIAAFDYWLGTIAEAQGQTEVELSAQRTITLAESRIEQVIAKLDELDKYGVDSCNAPHLETLRRATFTTPPIKELSILASNGDISCTEDTMPPGRRVLLSSQSISPADDLWLDVMAVGDPPYRMIRLRRQSKGSRGLAAILAPELLMPQASNQGGLRNGHVRLATSDGQLIGESGVRPQTSGNSNISSSIFQAKRYGLQVEVSLPRTGFASTYFDHRRIWLIATGGMALALGALAFVAFRRAPANAMSDLERALQSEQFVPYYQPIVDITTGQILGAEVLVRWRQSDGSVVGPGVFIPHAESTGLIMDLTSAVMKAANREIGAALEHRPNFKIGFNMVAEHFSDEKILGELTLIFDGSKIRLSQVVLEVTERQPIANLTVARNVIAALQGMGVRVAIDDVGTGHSGLSYMLKLGVDIIKIDKMFIDALGAETNATAIVETLIDLARSMRMEIVAEGVENFAQVVALRDRGIIAAQGFVFAPPLPGPAFLKLLEATAPQPDSVQASQPSTPAAAAAPAQVAA